MKKYIQDIKKSKIINTIINLFSKKDEIISVYLFGSFLKNYFSDIDIGILLKNIPTDILSYEIGLENQLEDAIGFNFDVRVLNKAPLSFYYNVIADGKVIIDKDPNFRIDLECKILKMYFDFDYYRKRYLADIIYAPI